MMVNKELRKRLEKLSVELTDKGRLIEAGWISLRLQAIDPAAPQMQLDEMRLAFFAGAQHLFGSIMTVLEPGDEPTDADMRRLDLIAKELNEFIAVYAARYVPTAGRG